MSESDIFSVRPSPQQLSQHSSATGLVSSDGSDKPEAIRQIGGYSSSEFAADLVSQLQQMDLRRQQSRGVAAATGATQEDGEYY